MVAKQSSNIALVTGATGFIGSHLTHQLVELGWRVHIVIRPSSTLGHLQRLRDSIAIHTHDGTTEGLFAIVEAVRPTVVFHLASLCLAQHTPADILPMLESNISFATHLVEAMVAHQIYYLVNTGTSWQHYENKEYSPVCLYAATKEAFEAILQFYIETTPLQVITLKLFDTYGPNDPRENLFTLLEKTAKYSKQLAMSPGEQLIELVYVDDVVDAYIVAASRLQSKEVQGHEKYEVSTGSPLKLKEIVEVYEQETGRKVAIKWGGRPYRNREVMVPWNKGALLPGWKAKVGIREGIRRIQNSRQ
ncbi:NAD-dependent epimerase/dehydratase family protein [Argonema antarcticum]|uniref:NAD-dependent epimerase/dehydratase family protein n=1 Tax=Argonema antarcticum TaxID=2942763 RepID=UPI002012B3B1|nr:NAD(P)-dependent oxidoreductase [Argonema antarcticum]MCL1470567.1 NAD(P)-dependent oxidoreductase [Argonema antarcticum A004/B2]